MCLFESSNVDVLLSGRSDERSVVMVGAAVVKKPRSSEASEVVGRALSGSVAAREATPAASVEESATPPAPPAAAATGSRAFSRMLISCIMAFAKLCTSPTPISSSAEAMDGTVGAAGRFVAAAVASGTSGFGGGETMLELRVGSAGWAVGRPVASELAGRAPRLIRAAMLVRATVVGMVICR